MSFINTSSNNDDDDVIILYGEENWRGDIH